MTSSSRSSASCRPSGVPGFLREPRSERAFEEMVAADDSEKRARFLMPNSGAAVGDNAAGASGFRFPPVRSARRGRSAPFPFVAHGN